MLPAPLSPYAVTKLASEHYCSAYHKVYGLPTTSLRYFNVYGPRQDPNGAYAAVIPKFILAALKGETLTIHGDGTQSRDFTYVADVVQANLLAAQGGRSDGQMMNIGAAGRTDLNELAREVVALAGSRSKATAPRWSLPKGWPRPWSGSAPASPRAARGRGPASAA
jgi:nucleoside-diphosphate-sugar epimerase